MALQDSVFMNGLPGKQLFLEQSLIVTHSHNQLYIQHYSTTQVCSCSVSPSPSRSVDKRKMADVMDTMDTESTGWTVMALVDLLNEEWTVTLQAQAICKYC